MKKYLLLLPLFSFLGTVFAAPPRTVDILSPQLGNTGYFGSSVTILPNGNFVVTASQYAEPGGKMAVGGVFLYGRSGRLISKLTGSNDFDYVGSHGVKVLANGHFVVCSPYWNGVRGAVTWGHQDTGVSGVVSASNSLVGSQQNDWLGSYNDDPLGYNATSITALPNGHYVVSSPNWNGDAGAVTWGNGSTGTSGVVSAANSVVGANTYGQVGSRGVVTLANGHYAFAGLSNPNSSGTRTGSVTWANGNGGTVGVVSESNSLMGETTNDNVGAGETGNPGIVALKNGNYVVRSGFWNGGRGAVTWGNGSIGIKGRISSSNSLVGSRAGDNVGEGRAADYLLAGNLGTVAALTNGHYVVVAPRWQKDGLTATGAIVWGNGQTGITGEITAANAVLGATRLDAIGSGGVAILPNGRFVVGSPTFKNGETSLGAATLFDGSGPLTGPLPLANSLTAPLANGPVGYRVTALKNGNYVVSSIQWYDSAAGLSGAVTLCDGNGTGFGTVTAANSITGFTNPVSVVPLANGNFVVITEKWYESGTFIKPGAVTWANGFEQVGKKISPPVSLVGSSDEDMTGVKVIPLTNGNYVVSSPNWRRGSMVETGAVTWGNGVTGITGLISETNSLVGRAAYDKVGQTLITPTSDGNYIVRSDEIFNGNGVARGASTLGDGANGTFGEVTNMNSVLGTRSPFFGGGRKEAYDPHRKYMLTGRPIDNRITFFSHGFVPGITFGEADEVSILLQAPATGFRTLFRSENLTTWPQQWQVETDVFGAVFHRDVRQPSGKAFYTLVPP